MPLVFNMAFKLGDLSILNFSKEVLTKITKRQRSQRRGKRDFCPKAMLRLHDKITDKNT
ncbi:hypothetical protein R84B8_02743 [Treponema sp. R8-4-B8]